MVCQLECSTVSTANKDDKGLHCLIQYTCYIPDCGDDGAAAVVGSVV